MTEKIRGTREEVRKFGLLMAAALTLIGLYLLYKGVETWYALPAVGGALVLGGYLAYPLVRPVYVGWMRFAFVLAWVNTRILLGAFFYLVMTPAGVLMRLSGKDLLDQKIEKGKESYWIRRPKTPFDRERYERLF